jgi:hypothetical protein
MIARTLLLSLPLLALQAHAINYGYHQDSALALGVGFNPSDLSVAKPRCIEYDEFEPLDGKGSPESNVDITYIASQKDLYTKVGFSAEVSAQTSFAKGSAKTSFLDEYEFHEDNKHFAILAYSDHGRWGLKNPRLKPQFQKLIDDGKHEEFARRCGTHYVFEDGRNSKVFAIYTVHNVNSAHEQRLGVSYDVAVTYADGKSKGQYNNDFKELLKSNEASLRVFAIGGQGITELKDVVINHLDIDAVKKTLRDYVSTMTAENGVPTRFKAASMDAFGWEDTNKIPNQKRDMVLKEYFFLLKRLSDEKTRVSDIVTKRDTEYAYLCDQSVLEYAGLSATLEHDWESLQAAAMLCFDDPRQCVAPKYKLQNVKWPTDPSSIDNRSRVFRMKTTDPKSYESQKYSKEECDQQRQGALAAGCITVDELRELRKVNSAPVCTRKGKFAGMKLCQ